MPPTRATAVLQVLEQAADPTRGVSLQRYFKSGPGQYGEGDRFLGLSMPQVRAFAKEYATLPLRDVEHLLESPWHEARALGLVILASSYRRASEEDRERIYTLYLRRTDRINNWDLVDVSAPQIVGAHLLDRSRVPLRRLARSKSLWERRIAIVATQYLIKHGQFADTLELARILIDDKHDLIHKAVGWMLREVGQKDERVLRAFLDREATRLPRTTLRYAIERLQPAVRKRYLSMRIR